MCLECLEISYVLQSLLFVSPVFLLLASMPLEACLTISFEMGGVRLVLSQEPPSTTKVSPVMYLFKESEKKEEEKKRKKGRI